jgi:hypothetical protein
MNGKYHQRFGRFSAWTEAAYNDRKDEPERLENLLLTERLRCDIIRDFIDTRQPKMIYFMSMI